MEKLSGTIERVTYYSPDSGYSVLKIMPDQKRLDAARDGTIAVVGVMPELVPGEVVEFTGEWVEDKQYGRQFRAETVATVKPTSRKGVINYLGSGLVKGIGPVTAQKIVDYLGNDTLDVLENNPDRLYDVPGVKRNLLEKLAKSWGKTQSVRETMIFLQGYGVSSRLAQRIHNHYGEDTIRMVQTDPYMLADDVNGIGFIKADVIAQSMGIEHDAHNRIRAGLQYTLNQKTMDGHVYLPRQELLREAGEILRVDNPVRVELVLDSELRNGELIVERAVLHNGDQVEAIYLPLYAHSERKAAEKLREISKTESDLVEEAKALKWDKFLAALTKQIDVNLTEQQQGAVKAALTNKVSVLTGGPGTGKTTTMRMVIEALNDLGYKFALASPTGRAAKRLSESTGYPASTIHRLLGYSPAEGGFTHNEDYPLEVDMVVVDESSMIDLLLFHSLLKAIKPETHFLLVGDVNQLPSVGAGNVLHDVIDSQQAQVTRLDQIFRQGRDSHIIVNAHRINHGQDPFMDNSSEDFFFFGEDDPQAVADRVVDVVKFRLPQKFDWCDPLRDVQVLAPMYRGPAGVDKLNERLQAALNSGDRYVEEHKLGGRVYRAGDKVMQTRNNYDKEVFNGDIGRIYGFDSDDNSMYVTMDDGVHVDYDFKEIDQIRHAFCISIHRSQGSEYPIVVLPVMTQHYIMLQRNLLYTAITRAKKVVVLVGSRKAVSIAVRNDKVSERYSGLLMRLRNPHLAGDELL
jgi:exodeoxyribonuclease V alpha subunit